MTVAMVTAQDEGKNGNVEFLQIYLRVSFQYIHFEKQAPGPPRPTPSTV